MMNRFEIPFQWLMIYFLLAYCIGSYVRDDMEGFGMQFMVKSGKRALWWWSKCLWAVLVNGLYFVLLFAVDVSFAWLYSGDSSITIHDMSLVVLYGNQAAEMGVGGIILYTIAVPLLVGVVQSLLQMVGNIAIGSVPTMVLLSALLVLSGYYGHRMLIHGYAMVCRYIPRSAEFEYDALDVRFGLVYLAVLVVLLAAAGYIIVRKKDILEKK